MVMPTMPRSARNPTASKTMVELITKRLEIGIRQQTLIVARSLQYSLSLTGKSVIPGGVVGLKAAIRRVDCDLERAPRIAIGNHQIRHCHARRLGYDK